MQCVFRSLFTIHHQIRCTNSLCTGDKLEPLYAPIRHKLGNALTSWHPSDGSAKIILAPWVGVFRQGHMDAFLVKNVLPKLGQVIEEMPITPHQQNLGKWHGWFCQCFFFSFFCVFYSHEKCVSMYWSALGWLTNCISNDFNVGIISDTINMINVKLFMMTVLINL